MNVSGVMTVLLFLTVFGVFPILLITLLGNRRKPTTVRPSSQECRKCGALNPSGREHCYSCGVGLPLPLSFGTEATVIERVRKADARKSVRRVEAQTHAEPI